MNRKFYDFIDEVLLNKDINTNEKLLLVAMATCVDEGFDNKGNYIKMSIDEICKLISCSKATAIRTVKSLEEKGLIVKEKKGFGSPNKFYIKGVQ